MGRIYILVQRIGKKTQGKENIWIMEIENGKKDSELARTRLQNGITYEEQGIWERVLGFS